MSEMAGSELSRIVALWQDAIAQAEECVLATLVRVEGSSYRKPGARMLITAGGRREGTISGGCLEAEVARKAFWLTERGPTIEQYQSSFEEDGSTPFGLGCGGTLSILLERCTGCEAVLDALQKSITARIASTIVTVIDTHASSGTEDAKGTMLASRTIVDESGCAAGELSGALIALANATLSQRQSSWQKLTFGAVQVELFAEYLPRATFLIVFGGGDDAQPVVELAAALGWQVAVADGRLNLIRQERFPAANPLVRIKMSDPLLGLEASRADAAVVMTHSYEQDRAAVAALLQTEIAYIGVLGPRHRTARLVADTASAAGWDAEGCMQRLHSPVGLDIGADAPASIALSIVAEIFSTLRNRSGSALWVKADLHKRKTPIELSA